MNNNDCFLVFISKKGVDYDGKYVYQLFFSNELGEVFGDEWDSTPALGKPQLPEDEFIDRIFEIKTEILFDLASESKVYSMDDCIDGVIALAYENITNYEEYPDPRLVFKYGETLHEVSDKVGESNMLEIIPEDQDEE